MSEGREEKDRVMKRTIVKEQFVLWLKRKFDNMFLLYPEPTSTSTLCRLEVSGGTFLVVTLHPAHAHVCVCSFTV